MFGDFTFGRGWFGRGDAAAEQGGGSGVTVSVSGQEAIAASGEVAVTLAISTVGGTSPRRKRATFRWHDLVPDWIRPPEPPQPEASVAATVLANGQTAIGASGTVTVRVGSNARIASRSGLARAGTPLARCGQRIICGGSSARARASSARVAAVKNLHEDELRAILIVLE